MIDWYASSAGVLVATIFVVSILKRSLAHIPRLNAVPTWVYAVLVSVTLTYLTVAVFHTQTGDLWSLMMQGVQSAAGASGVYEWVNNSPTTSLKESAQAAHVFIGDDD